MDAVPRTHEAKRSVQQRLHDFFLGKPLWVSARISAADLQEFRNRQRILVAHGCYPGAMNMNGHPVYVDDDKVTREFQVIAWIGTYGPDSPELLAEYRALFYPPLK